MAVGRQKRRGKCTDFAGNEDIPCRELDRAIKFNQEIMPELLGASYGRVRKAMTNYNLLGHRDAEYKWQVGHACPDPSKETNKDLPEDYGVNLFAQYAADNNRLKHRLDISRTIFCSLHISSKE